MELIVFTDHNVAKKWWQVFLKKPFYHCLLVRWIGNDTWLKIDPNTANMVCEIVDTKEVKDIIKQKNAVIVENNLGVDITNKMFNVGNILPTCVSIIKMVIGVNALVVTPYQLYRYLLNRGAKEINVNYLIYGK